MNCFPISRFVLGLGVAPVALMAASCSPAGSAEQSPVPPSQQVEAGKHPVSGLSIIPVVVENGDRRHIFKAELAASPQAQAKGLMFRTELGDDEGMLFPSELPTPRSFWMKNTPLSLDIIFIGTDGRISNIAANTVPYSLDSVLSEGATIAVLELRGGRSAELGIAAGDRVSWEIPEDEQ